MSLYIVPPRKVTASLPAEAVVIPPPVQATITVGYGLLASPSNPIVDTGTISFNIAISPTWSGTHSFSNAITFASAQTFDASKLTIGSQASGDLLFYNGSAWARRAIGTPGQFLTVSGGSLPTWGTAVTQITANNGVTGGVITGTGTVALDTGYSPTWSGTHIFSNAITFASAQTFDAAKLTIASQATGDLLYYNGSAWARRAVAADGYVLTLVSGVPQWSAGGGPGGGLTYTTVTGTTTMAVNTGYIVNGGGVVTLDLPASFAAGDVMEVVGLAGGWTITQASGQSVTMGTVSSTTGVSGSVSSVHIRDSIKLVAVTTTEWQVVSAIGTINLV